MTVMRKPETGFDYVDFANRTQLIETGSSTLLMSCDNHVVCMINSGILV